MFDSDLLISTVLLALGAAVSPVMLLNVSALVAARNFTAWRGFFVGSLAVTVVLAAAVLGFLGNVLQQRSSQVFASRTLDVTLGFGLFAYGAVTMHASIKQRQREKAHAAQVAVGAAVVDDPAAVPDSPDSPVEVAPAASTSSLEHPLTGYAAGVLGQATNFSSIVIFIAALQRLSTSDGARWEKWPLTLLVCLGMMFPVIGPRLLVLGSGSALTRVQDAIERPAKRFGPRLSSGAALLFGVLLVVHGLTR